MKKEPAKQSDYSLYVAGFTAIVGTCTCACELGDQITVAAFRLAPSPHWHYALAGARAELKFPSKNSNAFSHGDQKMSLPQRHGPEAGRRTPATQLQLSN